MLAVIQYILCEFTGGIVFLHLCSILVDLKRKQKRTESKKNLSVYFLLLRIFAHIVGSFLFCWIISSIMGKLSVSSVWDISKAHKL